MADASDSFVDLYWIPVGAGTRFQRTSLLLYEGVAAALARRRRAKLVHAGLKGRVVGRPFTLELMPSPPGINVKHEVTGPVGVRGADRIRLLRYQVCVLPNESLPDEQWAVEPPVRVAEGEATASRILELAKQVPAHTWGRRRPGQSEMWTSDSAVAWMLVNARVATERIDVPFGCRAPGWRAGLQEAFREQKAAALPLR